MHPTLEPGEYVLFDRLAFCRRQPRRGEVVLARHPHQPELRIIKRVFGLPGEKVAIRDGHIWLNEQIYEDSLGADMPEIAGEWRLTPEQYFLLGDALEMSNDGRHFGPTERNEILARAWLVYWPPKMIRVVR